MIIVSYSCNHPRRTLHTQNIACVLKFCVLFTYGAKVFENWKIMPLPTHGLYSDYNE